MAQDGGLRVNPSGKYLEEFYKERLGNQRITCLEDVEKLLALHDSEAESPYILFLVFERGYTRLLGKVAAMKWPFKLTGVELRKNYDLAVFIRGMMGKMITLHTRDKGLPR